MAYYLLSVKGNPGKGIPPWCIRVSGKDLYPSLVVQNTEEQDFYCVVEGLETRWYDESGLALDSLPDELSMLDDMVLAALPECSRSVNHDFIVRIVAFDGDRRELELKEWFDLTEETYRQMLEGPDWKPRLTQAAFVLPIDQVEGLCEPIMDPYIRSGVIQLKDRSGKIGDQVTIVLDDVILLNNPGGRMTLSRLGIINSLLDQVAPGLRLCAHVRDDSGDSSPANKYGLSLQVFS